jgi:hypothetical protein
MSVLRCQARISKKAWNNPLAPRDRCSRDAVEVVQTSDGERDVCALHARKASYGYVHTCGSLFYKCSCKPVSR